MSRRWNHKQDGKTTPDGLLGRTTSLNDKTKTPITATSAVCCSKSKRNNDVQNTKEEETLVRQGGWLRGVMGEPGRLWLRGGGSRRSRGGTVSPPRPDEAGRVGVPRREAALLRGRVAGGERDPSQWTYKSWHPGCHTPLSRADPPKDGETRCVSFLCHLSSGWQSPLICHVYLLLFAEPYRPLIIIRWTNWLSWYISTWMRNVLTDNSA